MKTLLFSLIYSTLFVSSLFGIKLNPDLTDNSLIVYNSNVGLVHESRKLNLKKNENEIIYEDVASSINTDSVNISLPNGISLFSQQYRFDKLTKAKLIDAHIGKIVSVKIKKDSKNFTTIKATLLSNDGASCIVKSQDKIIIVDSDNLIFKNIPKELITKPSLVWNIESRKNINSQMSIDYLIESITWKSNYVLNLHEHEADLSGWITIDNHSGKSFKDTNLHVLAGEINRAQEPRQNYMLAKSMVQMEYDSPTVEHKAHEGYHFYTIPFKVNLFNNEKTQLKFITQNDIPVERKYTVIMTNPNYLSSEINHDVTQYITMKGLEYPLPKGFVRTYSKLVHTNILLGETNIKHTPKNTPLSLKLGKNFDIKVKETILNREQGKFHIDVDVKYSIKNSSDETKTIEVLIPFNKNKGSKIKSDKKYKFAKGNLAAFNINVKPQSTKEFEVYYTTKIKN